MTKRSKPKRRRTGRSVLDLSATEARAFFLKPESYCRVELPPYFDFRPLLRDVEKFLAKTPYDSLNLHPRSCEDVNYTIYWNKDGRYAWRPFQLIHPVLYVHLVDVVTAATNWSAIKSRFAEFQQNPNIRCLSIPQQSLTKRKDQGAQILNWWHGIEQGTIDLALDFNYILHADIADCYASIYTHSIAWALHGRATAKKKKSDKTLIGNLIDKCIQDMQHGQTNGIPQGSVLLDFVAEMVLGYADLMLGDKLTEQNLNDFKILRYRDDYRILVNDTELGEQILKSLTEVLIGLGLKLNAAKTSGAQAVIAGALKCDKQAWMSARQSDRDLQKHLLIIHSHGRNFPNAGSLLVALDEYYKRLKRVKSVQNPEQLISIAVDIGYSNPRAFPACAAIVSKLLSKLRTKKERRRAVERICGRLRRLPNNGHLEVWMQRISYHVDPEVRYGESLCRLVNGEQVDLWNNSWITEAGLKALVDPSRIVNRKRLAKVGPIVPRSEFVPFEPAPY
jgi:hypothetical protein